MRKHATGRLWAIGLAGLLTLWSAAPASAQMVRAQDPDSIVAALRDAGYRAERDRDGQGDPLVRTAAGGKPILVLFYNCTGGSGCATVQFHTQFDGDKATADSINAWNRKARFGRAYIDEDGSVRLEMDLSLDDGGMSELLFIDHLEFFEAVMGSLQRDLGG